MNTVLNRREMIKGSVAFAALAFSQYPLEMFGFPDEDGTLIPFRDVQPRGRTMLRWEDLTSWITPNEQLFAVSHYGQPEPVTPENWQMDVSGLVKRPRTFRLEDLRSRPSKSHIAVLECSGNGSNPAFKGAIGNVKWTGVPLRSVLRECGLEERAIEVVFFGADQKVETIRDNPYTQHFGRSLARQDALRDEVLLAYEFNGEPLPHEHGGPVRLVVPGWFGIAWVKWLRQIVVLDRRFMSKYMAREYVTLRGREKDGATQWIETSVGPIDVKSVVARAVRLKDGTIRLTGAAWTDGTPLRQVEVRIDDGPWRKASLGKEQRARYGWTFFRYDWRQPAEGDHQVVSRAIDEEGRVQPAADDPAIKLKRTYWEANQQWPRAIRIETGDSTN